MLKANEEALKTRARAMRAARERDSAVKRKEDALRREMQAFVNDGPTVSQRECRESREKDEIGEGENENLKRARATSAARGAVCDRCSIVVRTDE